MRRTRGRQTLHETVASFWKVVDKLGELRAAAAKDVGSGEGEAKEAAQQKLKKYDAHLESARRWQAPFHNRRTH